MALPLAGAKILAADLANLLPGADGWLPYTPTWSSSGTAVSLGNGSLVGASQKVGRLTAYRITFTPGSTTTFGTGVYSWSLPVAVAAGVQSSAAGQGSLVDASAGARFFRTAMVSGAQAVQLWSEAGVTVAQTVPFTWANGDFAIITGIYEAAS